MHWSDKPVTPEPRDTIATPLGNLNIKVCGEYTLFSELDVFVTINRQLCRVCVNSRLILPLEEWQHIVNVDRIVYPDNPAPGRTWNVAGRATDNARAKARQAVIPPLEKWIDSHFDMIEQGNRIADANLILRARYRLEHAREEIAKREAELDAMQAYLDKNGALKREDRGLLSDLWGHHWSF